MNDIEQVRRAEQARAILESPLWIEAWELYRTRLLDIIERADSASVDVVMQAKRLLVAGTAARTHLELLVNNGKMSAETIRIDGERKEPWNMKG